MAEPETPMAEAGTPTAEARGQDPPGPLPTQRRTADAARGAESELARVSLTFSPHFLYHTRVGCTTPLGRLMWPHPTDVPARGLLLHAPKMGYEMQACKSGNWLPAAHGHGCAQKSRRDRRPSITTYVMSTLIRSPQQLTQCIHDGNPP